MGGRTLSGKLSQQRIKRRVQEAGRWGKKIAYEIGHVLVNDHDCLPQRGLVLIPSRFPGPDVLRDWAYGFFMFRPIPQIDLPAGYMLDDGAIQNIWNARAVVQSFEIRSPLLCTNPVCVRCYGADLPSREASAAGQNIGLAAAQALSEPLAQAFIDAEKRELAFNAATLKPLLSAGSPVTRAPLLAPPEWVDLGGFTEQDRDMAQQLARNSNGRVVRIGTLFELCSREFIALVLSATIYAAYRQIGQPIHIKHAMIYALVACGILRSPDIFLRQVCSYQALDALLAVAGGASRSDPTSDAWVRFLSGFDAD